MRRHSLSPLYLVVWLAAGLSCGGGGGDGGSVAGPTRPTPQPAVPARIALSPSPLTVDDAATATITATVYDQNGAVMGTLPNNGTLAWSSGAADVASVAGGQVTGVRPGQATVTAAWQQVGASVEVTVRQVATALRAVTPGTPEAAPGTTLPDSVRVRVTDRHGAGVPGVAVTFATRSGRGAVSPATATTDVAGAAAAAWTVGSAAGADTVDAGAGSLPGATFVATVRAPATTTPATPATPVAPSIALDRSSLEVEELASAPLTATVKDGSGNVVTGRAPKWSSANTEVVSVSPAGVVTALSPGETTVKAEFDGVSATATVKVKALPVASLTINTESVPGYSDTFTIKVTAVDGAKRPLDRWVWINTNNFNIVETGGPQSAANPVRGPVFSRTTQPGGTRVRTRGGSVRVAGIRQGPAAVFAELDGQPSVTARYETFNSGAAEVRVGAIRLSVNPSSVAGGEIVQVNAEPLDEFGKAVPKDWTLANPLEWVAEPDGAAEMVKETSGADRWQPKLVARRKGTVTIRVSYRSSRFPVEASTPLTIRSNAPGVRPFDLAIERPQSVKVGAIGEVTLRLSNVDRTPFVGPVTVTWRSENNAVASITESRSTGDGYSYAKVVGRTRGGAIIQADAAGEITTAFIAVYDRVASVDVYRPIWNWHGDGAPRSYTLGVGGKLELTTHVSGSDGQELLVPASWSVVGPAGVLTVDATGTVTARGAGEAVIVATVDGVRGEARVKVVP